MKIVQTSISEEEYEALRKILKRREMSVKEGVREAIQELGLLKTWTTVMIPS